MTNVPENIKDVMEEFVEGIYQILGGKVKKIVLYGSYARGEENQNGETSDIDIMILVDMDSNEIKKIEKSILDYSYDIDLKYDVLLSPIIENVDEYNKRMKYMAFYKNINKEGVVLNG